MPRHVVVFFFLDAKELQIAFKIDLKTLHCFSMYQKPPALDFLRWYLGSGDSFEGNARSLKPKGAGLGGRGFPRLPAWTCHLDCFQPRGREARVTDEATAGAGWSPGLSKFQGAVIFLDPGLPRRKTGLLRFHSRAIDCIHLRGAIP